MLKIIFFWDYDTQWGADRSRSGSGPKDWGSLEFTNTERLFELHAEYNIPACFAVVGAAALPGERPYHDPKQIKRIHELGHEVASHSFHHDWLPELNRQKLKDTLLKSKDALEQCIGSQVTSFVPPYNQPYDYPGKLSFSLSERKLVKQNRTNLPILCETLAECGYKFSRVSYRTLAERAKYKITGNSQLGLSQLETINDIKCIRLNTVGGFKQPIINFVLQNIDKDGYIVIYGHPHSLSMGNSQDEKYLVPLMQKLQELHTNNKIKVLLPKQIIQ